MDKDYVDKLYIGSLDLSQISLDEASVGKHGFPDGLGECKLYVYGGERNIPHFHIESKDGKFVCCVQIYEPYYFIHPGKEGTLNSAQRKELDKYLRSAYKTPVGGVKITIWQMICIDWNNANPDYAVFKKNATQPDYNKLQEGKPSEEEDEKDNKKKKGVKESTWLSDSLVD